jgi:yecA family protein
LSSFETLDEALKGGGLLIGAAEAHGMLCGLLCAQGGVTFEDWIIQVLGEEESADASLGASEQALRQIYEDTVEQLSDLSYGLSVLLPADEEPLTARSQALADWCRGFLFGLALGPDKPLERLAGDAAEASKDLSEIGGLMSATVREGNEEDEQAYAELTEYVRAGVMLIYEELQRPSTGSGNG